MGLKEWEGAICSGVKSLFFLAGFLFVVILSVVYESTNELHRLEIGWIGKAAASHGGTERLAGEVVFKSTTSHFQREVVQRFSLIEYGFEHFGW